MQRRSVAELVVLLKGDWCGRKCDLECLIFSSDVDNSAAVSVHVPQAAPATPARWDVALRDQATGYSSSNNEGCSFDIVVGNTLAGMYYVATEGTSLQSGHLYLQDTERLVFGPECKSIALSNVTIHGATSAARARQGCDHLQ